ncbi:putative Xanthine phosphoribosyltransferase [Selenomonas ruminantium subsp. lactilytica TAM6421]|uniref:Xanthine phosphoribosyltransferase n=1 Tax=Selenomonas ruminantium subsp. lactilytica (strain NBRC 103574 / TAM6421) TaxID=927704 RepID=I0GM40_SELRL|nr:xanthine phosphoribosyltransferase [Selenomonas ruminantium]BAL81827.1 putative Xanthine phosphoribosyltransferase [Selenomonas ruminantium subsp. lactilytica TAM6421]
MELLKERILKEGHCLSGNILKVDSFVNHQIDPEFTMEMGKEFVRRFADVKIDKVLTIESSGIAIGMAVAYELKTRMVFARKNPSLLMQEDMYTCPITSYTKKEAKLVYVLKKFLQAGENILIIDDFMADGNAALGLANIVEQAGGKVVGIGIAIEKSFQQGAQRVRDAGYRVESLARIASLENEQIKFVED